MTRSPKEISSAIIAKLGITDPALSLEIGTPERKIIDAVSEAVSEAYLDAYITRQGWDIDTMTGVELERFVALFGMGRLEGRRATGKVSFVLSTPASQPMTVPGGTQVFSAATLEDPQVYYSTLLPAILDKGQTRVDVAAECVVVGTIGNCGVSQVNGFTAQVGVASVTNNEPFSGGMDPESDDQLRKRFRETFMRNIAGTEDFYEALCMQHDSVTKVKVMGPEMRWREQLQVVNGEAISTIEMPHRSYYVWPNSFFVSKNFGSVDEEFFVNGMDYTVSVAALNHAQAYARPVKFTIRNASKIPNGTVLDVEFGYTFVGSRNDPPNQVANKIDIWTNGIDPVESYEEVLVGDTVFNNTTSGSIYSVNQNAGNRFWRRRWMDGSLASIGGMVPVSGNGFTRLGNVPVVSFPTTIQVGTTTLKEGVDYIICSRMDSEVGSDREITGIEWLKSATKPSASTRLRLVYTYDRLPEVLNAFLEEERPVASDPLVHQQTPVDLKVRAFMMYEQGYTREATDAAVRARLAQWFAEYNFGAWIQFSDLEAVIHGVTGVDNVRIPRQGDNSGFGLEHWRWGQFISGWYKDLNMLASEIPTLFDFESIPRSYNTWTN